MDKNYVQILPDQKCFWRVHELYTPKNDTTGEFIGIRNDSVFGFRAGWEFIKRIFKSSQILFVEFSSSYYSKLRSLNMSIIQLTLQENKFQTQISNLRIIFKL